MNAKINNTDQILVKYFLNQRKKLIELSLRMLFMIPVYLNHQSLDFVSIKPSHFMDFKKDFCKRI